MMIKRNTFAAIWMAGVGLAVAGAVSVAPVAALAQDDEEDAAPRRQSQTLEPAVGAALTKIYELMTAEQFQPALAELNKLMAERGERMKAYDRATTLELRGSVKINLEDYRGALKDFQDALASNGLPPERNNQLRYYIAQIQFQLEDYQAAIRGLNEWINLAKQAGVSVDSNAYYLLAAAYTQITPPNYRQAMGPAELAVAALVEPRKGYYDLLNLIYSELNENTKRAALLEKMIQFFPSERSYWTQLSGLYSTTQRDKDAFSVLEVAYRAGLLKNENEILTLVQYYSFFDNPYRGAKLMERELEAGIVKRNVKNLTLLSQLWSQAREHKRAIPVLQEAARQADTGELSYRLGQVLLADERYKASESALVAAINKGGMSQIQTGDCWLLLGTARFSQAGPGDKATRTRAREAFVRAQNYANTRTQANQWVQYIDAINSTEKAQDDLERAQRLEAAESEVQRTRQSLIVCQLQARPQAECDAIEQRMNQQISEVERLKAAPTAPAETPAAGGGEESPPASQPAPANETTPAEAPAEPPAQPN